MKNEEIMAMVGKKVTLTMSGKYLNGNWEVEIVGLVKNNPKFTHHAKVLWKKPAMPDFGYGAKPAEKVPTVHYVPIQNLSFKGMKESREKAEKKVAAEKNKVAQPKKTEMMPKEISQALRAINSLKAMIENAGYEVDLQ